MLHGGQHGWDPKPPLFATRPFTEEVVCVLLERTGHPSHEDSEGDRFTRLHARLPFRTKGPLISPQLVLTSGMTIKAPVIIVSTILIPNNHLRNMK